MSETKNLLLHLKNLCDIAGVSGNESNVSDYIINNLPNTCTYEIDPLGNLIVNKKGENSSKADKKLMIVAHMDEVGFIINAITEDGMLKFSSVGGIDKRVVFQRAVEIGENKVYGIIGANPIHLLKSDEVDQAVKIENMYIDIGATTKEEAEKLISLGDYANFLPNYETFGDGFIKSKAIDDRFGCAVMLNLLKKSFEDDLVFVFAVQEEIGLIGSTVAAFSQNPDFALVIDATTAGDVAGVSEEDSVCKLSGGGVITIMDRHTIYDRQLVNLVMDTAKQNNINAQFKRAVAGGNDAGAVHKSRGGVRTVAISLPTRYIHSENCVAKISDIESTAKLINKAIEEIIKL